MKKIVLFFIVFVVTMFISNALLGSSSTDILFIRLLISGLIASVVFWLVSVKEEQENTDNT